VSNSDNNDFMFIDSKDDRVRKSFQEQGSSNLLVGSTNAEAFESLWLPADHVQARVDHRQEFLSDTRPLGIVPSNGVLWLGLGGR
jgi:hypothetical protein